MRQTFLSQRGLIAIAWLVACIVFETSAYAGKDGKPIPRLGTNLTGPADWNTELPFVDVFRMSRPWISQRQGTPWGQGPPLEMDSHGWVKRLEPDCWAETLLCTIEGGHYPSGRYTLFYQGHGEIELAGAAKQVKREPGKILMDVDSTKGPIFLRIKRTDPDDYIRDIHVIMPGFDKTWRTDPFHPKFLKRWKGIACFRFMDWMHTNGSTIKCWDDRPTLDDATFSVKGIPLPLMIELCNRLEADAWFCMPHQCDDDYVRRFAQVVRKRLAPNRNVYIEYSNEVWNSQFSQNDYAQQQGKKQGLGPADRPWEGGGMFYSRRSVEIFKIWSDVFQGGDALVRVLAWQAGSTWWLEHIILPQDEAAKYTDALALAPYFGMRIPPQGEPLNADRIVRGSVDDVLDYVEKESLPQAIKRIRDTGAVAKKYGLTLVAYEGGQHLVGIRGAENNERLTERLMQANAHARMGRIYQRYLDAWVNEGGDLFCHFSSVSRWSKWGCWGVLQYYDDDPNQSPKFKALIAWARKRGQKMEWGEKE